LIKTTSKIHKTFYSDTIDGDESILKEKHM